MSNYNQITFFGPKDSLPTTDPNKTIFGAQYDTEFGNISTAIASKADASALVEATTGTLTGQAADNTTAASVVGNYTKIGHMVSVSLPSFNCTIASAGLAGVGLLPSSLFPAFAQVCGSAQVSGIGTFEVLVSITTLGAITFSWSGGGTGAVTLSACTLTYRTT